MEWIKAKTILQKATHGNEWFGIDYNMNLYKGCCHKCIYCDSRSNCYQVEDFDRVRAKKDEIEIKIIIHTDTPLLYKIDYFDIKKDYKNKIYYYKNNFYLELENKINKDKYLKLLEVSEVIYEDTHQIINNGLKIKV